MRLSHRLSALGGLLALVIAAQAMTAAADVTLTAVIAGDWRSPQERARDMHRHPAESLAFWGLTPGATILDVAPGDGWWTQILAPYAARTRGRYYATAADLSDPATTAAARAARARFAQKFGDRAIYGSVELVDFGTRAASLPQNHFDLILVARSVHGWVREPGATDRNLAALARALKPGGVLAIEQHRANPGSHDPLAATGYVTEAYVIEHAEQAGLKLDARSEINANPRDTKDHPFGVWTLPPTHASVPGGSGLPPNPAFDHARFDAIGESDRMTLRFVKPALEPGVAFRDCAQCPEMVVIPAGSVTVGAGEAEHAREHATPEMVARETPMHQVTIARPLAVGRYEVTRGEFAAFVAATSRAQDGCTVMGPGGEGYVLDPTRSFRDPGYPQTDRHPVVCVNWEDARAYVAWLSATTGKTYRLLSEGEWEYAARAGTTTARWWGDGRDDACSYANVQALDRFDGAAAANASAETFFQCRDGYPNTAPAGSFKANSFGLYDIHGNVWEWTEDCYDRDVHTAPADGSAYKGGECTGHMDRGASWQNSPRYLRAAVRHKDFTTQRNLILGLRVARQL